MIIVKLTGGMGNQMFQYAAARRLAILHNTTMKLDLTFLLDTNQGETKTYRPYALDVFSIKASIAQSNEIGKFFRRTWCNPLKRLGFEKRNYAIVTEPHFHFWPVFFESPSNSYLEGYWQSEKYFLDISEIIRSEFTPKYMQDTESQGVADIIRGTQSVSIHVRRGDYVSDPATNQTHGTCSIEYYQRCANLIAERVSSPHFFVFSDDPRWITENLFLNYPTTFVIHNNARRSYEDVRLMSLCKHNIISNSSFGWWGAWLNKHPAKIVCAPKRWFNISTINTSDLIPDGWVRI